jgi:hypothetical protein
MPRWRSLPYLMVSTVIIDRQGRELSLLGCVWLAKGIAMSVKLAIHENRLEGIAENLEYIPDRLSQGAKLNISRNQALMKTGELMALRHRFVLCAVALCRSRFFYALASYSNSLTDTTTHVGLTSSATFPIFTGIGHR